jgi:hypothetical protein
MQKPSPWVGVLIAIIAGLGGFAISLVALNRPTATGSVRQLTAQLRTMRTELDRDNSAIRSLQSEVTATESSEGKVSSAFGKLQGCIPELIEQINGLVPEVREGRIMLTQQSQISRYCSSVFFPVP